VRVIGFTGWSGAGKTTLIEKLIAELRGRNLTVATVKHAHAGFDIDQPGKDTYRHRAAGAREVLVASSRRVAVIRELDGEDEPHLADLLLRLGPVDLVLVEGFKAYSHPKIEVHRAASGKPLMGPDTAGLVALATDMPTLAGAGRPVVHLDDVAAIADLALAHAVEALPLIERLRERPRPARLPEPAGHA